MKVGIFTDTFLPQVNGIVSATVNLAKRLADRGHEVHIIAPRLEKRNLLRHPGVHVKRIPGIKAGFYDGFKLTPFLNPVLYRYIWNKDIDVCHPQPPMSLGFETLILGKFLRKPVIGTFHAFFADKEYLKHVGLDNNVFEKLAWSYATFFYNMPTLVTAPSAATKRELIRQGCKTNIEVISNGIDMTIFDNRKKEDIRKKYGRGGPMMLYFGRIAHEKNHIFLMEVMKEVFRKEPSATLLMVGGGPQEKEIEDRARELGISDNVHFLGMIEHKRLIRSGILGACEIFVTASKTENQPMTILEAQANGIVCIGPDARGIPDLITHDRNGLLVEPDDKEGFVNSILSVIQNAEYRDRLRMATLEDIKQHDIERVVDRWEEVYAEAIELNKK